MSCCPLARKFFLVFVGLLAAGSTFIALSSQPAAADKEEKLLRHVVMFQFKESSSKADVEHIVDEFRRLPGKIPQIADFEFGTNNSPENLADGFTHCFLVTFKSEKDREAYLPHQAHKDFVEVLSPHLEKVMVLDYWAGK